MNSSRDFLFDSSESLHRVVQSEVYLLGAIQDVNLGGTCTKDPDVQLIDKLEEAQVGFFFSKFLIFIEDSIYI